MMGIGVCMTVHGAGKCSGGGSTGGLVIVSGRGISGVLVEGNGGTAESGLVRATHLSCE